MARWLTVLAVAWLVMGCDDTGASDAGPSSVDAAGPGETDAGPGGADAGPDGADAGPGGADAGPSSVDAGPGGADGGLAGRAIPDPGATMDRWAPAGMIDVPDGHGTPETAWQVGVVTEDPWYIGGRTDAVTGDVFWVFRTSPTITRVSVPLRGLGVPDIEYLHLHDGAGGMFGAEIAPDSYTRGTAGGRPSIDATWTVLPDHVYVVEVHGSMGTFF